MPFAFPLVMSVVMAWPAVTPARAVWPMTAEVSPKPFVGLSAIATSLVVTMSAVILLPSGMSVAATTMLAVVGTGGVPLPVFPVHPEG